MFMLRVLDSNGATVDWNLQFADYSAAEAAVNPALNKKEPVFMMEDPKTLSVLYLIGRYRGKGSVIRFQKRDGNVRWHAQYEKMTRINSVFSPKDGNDLFLCGEFQPNEAKDPDSKIAEDASNVKYQAVMARMKDDGDVTWVISASGKHPNNDGVTYMD